MITFYYGMSGAFKATTIKKKLEEDKNLKVLWSKIKSWKNLENTLFNGLIEYNDLNYALLHLTMLEDKVNELDDKYSGLLVERGVTDMIFYKTRDLVEVNDMWVGFITNYEEALCKEKPEKILLIQKDVKFIENVILNEPSRREKFPDGVGSYLLDQEKYIDFTKKYNDITEIIEITNAEDYITNTLGMEFNILKN